MLTGKELEFGGARVRTEATGYGVVYFTQEMLAARGTTLDGPTVVVSGSGNVAIHAIEKAHQLGARVIACSDSNGYDVDEKGVDDELLRQVKEVERARLTSYADRAPHARHVTGGSVWDVPCEVALPCATENELDGTGVNSLVQNGMHPRRRGREHADDARRGQAAPRGRRRVRPAQSSERRRRRGLGSGDAAERVTRLLDVRALGGTSRGVHARHPRSMPHDGEDYGSPGDYIAGANIAGFERVAGAMHDLGLVKAS